MALLNRLLPGAQNTYFTRNYWQRALRQRYWAISWAVHSSCRSLGTLLLPHPLGVVFLLLHWHGAGVGHIVQAVVCCIVQRLPDLVLPSIVRHLGVRLRAVKRQNTPDQKRSRRSGGGSQVNKGLGHQWPRLDSPPHSRYRGPGCRCQSLRAISAITTTTGRAGAYSRGTLTKLSTVFFLSFAFFVKPAPAIH